MLNLIQNVAKLPDLSANLRHPIFKVLGDAADEAGLEAYVVGGFVRDLLLERPSKDIDIVVVGSGISFAQRIGKKLNKDIAIFKNFGTANLKYQDLEVEFVGARKESYRSESRKPIVENGTLADDQLRRDFTVNAMAIQLNAAQFGKMLDPFGGLDHLERRLIKTPIDSKQTFSDDPLRMMRAIRFATQLDFQIDALAIAAIEAKKERIKIISQERITDELNKIIASPKPSIGFKLLFDTGLLKIIFPQMTDLSGVDYIAGKGHKNNFYHTLEVLDNISIVTNDLWLRWAAILHDIAKPATKRFDPNHGWTFHGHEDKGARMVPKIFAQLKLPQNEKMKFVQKLVKLHLRPIVLAEDVVTDSAVRRLLFDSGEEIESLMMLCNADVTTKNDYKKKKYRRNFELVNQKIKDVEERDQLRNWQPPITGEDIMKTFNLLPGIEVGKIKNAIREAILEGDINNDFEEAYRFMVKFAISIGLRATE